MQLTAFIPVSPVDRCSIGHFFSRTSSASARQTMFVAHRREFSPLFRRACWSSLVLGHYSRRTYSCAATQLYQARQRLDKGMCVCDQDLRGFPPSSGLRHGVVGSPAGSALTLAEREDISRGIASGATFRSIAERLGRAPSTVSREPSGSSGRSRLGVGAASQGVLARVTRRCAKLSRVDWRWSGRRSKSPAG
jgi:hypothetical protein